MTNELTGIPVLDEKIKERTMDAASPEWAIADTLINGCTLYDVDAGIVVVSNGCEDKKGADDFGEALEHARVGVFDVKPSDLLDAYVTSDETDVEGFAFKALGYPSYYSTIAELTRYTRTVPLVDILAKDLERGILVNLQNGINPVTYKDVQYLTEIVKAAKKYEKFKFDYGYDSLTEEEAECIRTIRYSASLAISEARAMKRGNVVRREWFLEANPYINFDSHLGFDHHVPLSGREFKPVESYNQPA